jgi:hypothetical protein
VIRLVRFAGVCVALFVLTGTVYAAMHPPEGSTNPARAPILLGIAWIAFGAGFWLLRKIPTRATIPLIMLGAIALQLAAGFAPPRSSDDLYRYIWDGRVQAAGIDPYRYPPAAPALVPLRDPELWPQQSRWCVESGEVAQGDGAPLAPGCTLINRPAVNTIYPPVGEAYFALVHALSPRGGGTAPIQLAASFFALATTFLLWYGLRRLDIDVRLAALWAWCPTIAVEAANNAHVDVVAAFVTAAALLVIAQAKSSRALGLGGALLGLAVATKLTPILIAPALVRRRPVLLASAAIGAIALVYLPHVVAVGAGVLGYLPGYLQEEGYTSGGRFALLTMVVPAEWASVLAVVILFIVGLLVMRHTDPQRPWRSAVVMTGAALAVTTPGYPWYAVLLVVLVAFDGRAEWLGLAAAGYLALYAQDLGWSTLTGQRIGYLSAVAAIVLTWWLRRYRRIGPVRKAVGAEWLLEATGDGDRRREFGWSGR